MAEAIVVDYSSKMWIPGGCLSSPEKGMVPDQEFTRAMKDVYVPSERILVRTNNYTPGMGQILCGPPYLMYSVFTGDGAQKLHDGLMAELGGKAKTKKVEVAQKFIDWALALHHAQNADKAILDLLV